MFHCRELAKYKLTEHTPVRPDLPLEHTAFSQFVCSPLQQSKLSKGGWELRQNKSLSITSQQLLKAIGWRALKNMVKRFSRLLRSQSRQGQAREGGKEPQKNNPTSPFCDVLEMMPYLLFYCRNISLPNQFCSGLQTESLLHHFGNLQKRPVTAISVSGPGQCIGGKTQKRVNIWTAKKSSWKWILNKVVKQAPYRLLKAQRPWTSPTESALFLILRGRWGYETGQIAYYVALESNS